MKLQSVSNSKKYLITVVTVSYNAVDIIEKTIQSVINQKFIDFEYIIIDGGSTDGTVQVIKKYQKYISYWLSEADSGLYYAMNKGIEKASGKWINFMNCGDTFANEYVLCSIFHSLNDDVEVVYGNSIINVGINRFILIPSPLTDMKQYLPFCHQSCFVKTYLMKKYQFDVTYRYVADYKFFYDLYQKRMHFAYINIPIAFYETNGGLTASNIYKCYEEKFRVNGLPPQKKVLLVVRIKEFCRKLIPQLLQNKFRSYIYRKNTKRYILLLK